MTLPKATRPAVADATNGPRDSDQLAREIDPTNNPKSARPQAPDDDRTYFVMRPGVTERLRLPFQTEFAPEVLSALGRTVMVRAVVHRDPITRKPTIWRSVLHVEGGSA